MRLIVVLMVVAVMAPHSAAVFDNMISALHSVGDWTFGAIYGAGSWFSGAENDHTLLISRPSRSDCRRVCPQVCSGWTSFLTRGSKFVCTYVCQRRRDSAVQVNMPVDGHVIPLVRDPSYYDVDNDGRLSLMDLLIALDVSPNDQIFAHIFEIADTNADGYLNDDDFNNGPFVFEDDTELIEELTRPVTISDCSDHTHGIIKRYL